MPRRRGRAERNELADGHASAAQLQAGRLKHACPQATFSPYSCTLPCISVYLCNSKPPHGWGGGRPSCLGGCSLYAKALREQPTRREDGGWVGERTIWIFPSSCLCSFVLFAMVQYSVSNKTKRSHTDHFRCSVMLFPYALFDMLPYVFSYILYCSIRYSLFVLQSAFTQILLDLEIRLRYYCTAIFQTTKTVRRSRTITVTVTPAMNSPCAFFPIS